MTYRVGEEDEQENEVPSGSSVTIHVNLERDEDDDDEEEEAPSTGGPAVVVAPRFPGKRTESWWLVVGNTTSNQVLCLKRIQLKATQTNVKMEMIAPAPGDHSLTLFVMCDSYIGCDQEYQFSLKVGAALEESSDEDEEMDEAENE